MQGSKRRLLWNAVGYFLILDFYLCFSLKKCYFFRVKSLHVLCWNFFLFGGLYGTEQALNSKKNSVLNYLWHKK